MATDPTNPPLTQCKHCQFAQPHTPMWAAFRTGSAGRRWAGRCGHRLTAHYIGRVSRRQAVSTPDFATAKPAHSALIGRYYCAPRLITTSKVPRLRLVCLSIDGVRKRIKSASLHRVSVRQVSLTPDGFPLCQTQCSTGRSVTPMVRQGHTQCSNRLVLHYRSLQAQCSRCARGLSVG